MRTRTRLGGFLVAATLARGADAGAAVGLILLAVDPAIGLRHPERIAGLLAAALTVPHLLGPWSARLLDRARHVRVVLVVALLGYAIAVAAGTLSVGRLPSPLAMVFVALAGCCGPMLTGGLSSQLPDLAPRRRAAGLDATTYSVAASVGPAAVAGAANVAGARGAMLAMSVAVLLAAGVLALLPSWPKRDERGAALRVRQTLRTVVAVGPLRRVAVATCVVAFGSGLVLFASALLGPELGGGPGSGAALVAVTGVGAFVGALLMTWFPPRGELEIVLVRAVWPVAALLALTALAPSFGWAAVGFVIVGLVNAPFVTASLAARNVYAPPGGRAQIFVSIAGLKVAAVAAGSATGGLFGSISPRNIVLLAAAVLVTGACAVLLDRRTGGAEQDVSQPLSNGSGAEGLGRGRGRGLVRRCGGRGRFARFGGFG
jgi:MFS family permease